ncbi:MAG TPA: hypothetical protein ENN88_02230 [Candidatus Coatesbacteria bacterium]|nr:hypothetical protein [Candidatus Coatesbacteria bacterium]
MTRRMTLTVLLLATLALAFGVRVGEGEVKVTLPSSEWQYEDYGTELYAWWPNPDDPELDFGNLSIYHFQVSPLSETAGRADLDKTLSALADMLDSYILGNYAVLEMGEAIRETGPYLMAGRFYTDEGYGWGEGGDETRQFFNLDALYLQEGHIFAANLYTVGQKADELKGLMPEVLKGIELPEWETDLYGDGAVISLGGYTLVAGDGPWVAFEDLGGVRLTAYDGFDEKANMMIYWVDEPDPTGEKTAAVLKDELKVFLDEYFTGFEVEYLGHGFAREGECPYAAWAYRVDMGQGVEYHYDAQQLVAGQSYYLEAAVPATYEARMAPVVTRMAEGLVIEPGAGDYSHLWELFEDVEEEPDGE